jgi:hypothetical protein
MTDRKNEIIASEATQGSLSLERRLGHHDAFNAVANRCSAADAETLREIMESGQYQQTSLTWEEFCPRYVGVSRSYADRLIRHLKVFGPNYFRLSELVEMSPATYRLLAPALSDAGLLFEGQTIALKPENRGQIQAAVDTMRSGSVEKPRPALSFEAARKRLLAAIKAAEQSIRQPQDQLVLIGTLNMESARLDRSRPE